METLHLIVLALIQGLTEFLPISSSAHLILPSQLLGWPDQGPTFDVAVHLGTLLAVLAYFRHDLVRIVVDWFRSVTGGSPTSESRMAWYLVWATLPAVVFGGIFSLTGLDDTLRSTGLIAATTLVFGVLLGWADLTGKLTQSLETLTLKQAMIIGFVQAVALIPGTSRSGITITAGLFLGLTREASARFSFLLSIPVVVAASSLKILQLVFDDVTVDWGVLISGIALSAISAFICIHYFLALINRIGLMPFVIYRLLLGVFLLGMVWFG
ncbi:MAG: undecaprenyl-diphosphate phosphatase [Endozoicomonadaceae bacterium]|nr:undecaprenyl-diphosphate phosphatase [Endozoicomonadaceae bacterium]